MPHSSHRARSRSGRTVPGLVPALLVAVLVVVALVAVVRLAGAGATSETALDLAPDRGPTTATDPVADPGGPTTPPSDDAVPDDPSSDGPSSNGVRADALPVVTPRRVERLLDARRSGLQDRVREAEQLARAVRRRAELLTQPFDVRIASFNVLGSQHTGAGGDRQNFAPDGFRAERTADIISGHGVDIIGLQEVQPDQLNTITARTGLTAYPGYSWGAKDTDNSILYDAGTYEMVGGDRFYVTFGGRPKAQPILRLRVRATGREFYVVNSHPAAGSSRTGERYRGHDTLVRVVNDLRSTGLPVLVTGDMNDREQFYCRVVARAGLVAANGGGAGCSPPPGPLPVDWVVGTPDITFDGYVRDTKPTDQRISDHFFIVATAHVG